MGVIMEAPKGGMQTMIETRLLQYFLTVAQQLNITKAAEMLYITQPTLSKQMMELEQQRHLARMDVQPLHQRIIAGKIKPHNLRNQDMQRDPRSFHGVRFHPSFPPENS